MRVTRRGRTVFAGESLRSPGSRRRARATLFIVVVTNTTDELVERALAEDVGDGDVTVAATVDPGAARRRDDHPEGARRRSSASTPPRPTFRALDPDAADRAARARGRVARAAGAGAARRPATPARCSTAERTALNFLRACRASRR